MENLQELIKNYLEYCKIQKQLDKKTLKSYQIDLRQFSEWFLAQTSTALSADDIENYIAELHAHYKPRTVRRKIASLKAFFNYLEYKDIINQNPFHKIHLRFREPIVLPKTIPIHTIKELLSIIYRQYNNAQTQYQKINAIRDAAIIELLFATGIRISELCSIKKDDIDLFEGTILIHGKGNKERLIQIGSNETIAILQKYRTTYKSKSEKNIYFFVNQSGSVVSDQSVRRMINKYCSLAAFDLHITPHMFRHTFATSLLDAGVDIRYIQEMLGHSSINVTEIYTHVSIAKQKNILISKHPRKDMHINFGG